jgi:hypothetical protein
MPRQKTVTLDSPRTTTEIYTELMKAEEHEDEKTTENPELTYEQGVGDTLRWILGSSNVKPMTKE